MALPDLLNAAATRYVVDDTNRAKQLNLSIGFYTSEGEKATLHLSGEGITLLDGLHHAQVVAYAPLSILTDLLNQTGEQTALPAEFCLLPRTAWHYALLNRFLSGLNLSITPLVERLQAHETAGYFERPLRYPVSENPFLYGHYQPQALPAYDPEQLPRLILDAHPTWVAMYDKAWQIAFNNLRQPEPETGFVANFIDTSFNDNTFLWDSCFMTMFGRYARRQMDFMGTLDNFYAKQHMDGFICREISTYNGHDRWVPYEGRSTGPNILAWTEWLNYQTSGDLQRLRDIFPAVVAYHHWWKDWRTYKDGTYWTTGLGSGMDNQTRVPDSDWHHRHYVWIDAMMQQALSCLTLLRIAASIDRHEFDSDLKAEYAFIRDYINSSMWDEGSSFYYDQAADGGLSAIKSIGAYWGLLAKTTPPERVQRLVAHLQDPAVFNRPHRIPTQSADSGDYFADGRYWRGGVWSPTNYMVLRGLTENDQHALAHEIALNHLDMLGRVFTETGTLWENYAPEYAGIGQPARSDFVGWTGISAIAIPIEYLVGLRPRPHTTVIDWDIRLSERHGVLNYPLPLGGQADFVCEPHDDQLALTVRSSRALTLVIHHTDQQHMLEIEPHKSIQFTLS